MNNANRIAAAFAKSRPALVCFVTAGDGDTAANLDALVDGGADVIELGMPFTDPMADGPIIQAAGQRALAQGGSVSRTLAMLRAFRKEDDETPVVLMGYYNPIYARPGGVEGFLAEASEAGVDGLIIVDLPPEEEGELCIPARDAGLNFIYLTAPRSGLLTPHIFDRTVSRTGLPVLRHRREIPSIRSCAMWCISLL